MGIMEWIADKYEGRPKPYLINSRSIGTTKDVPLLWKKVYNMIFQFHNSENVIK